MKKLICGRFADGTKGSILTDGNIISAVNPKETPSDCGILDFGENYILPAFIEVHAHGADNFDFSDNTNESFEAIMNAHLSHGVASLSPTLCACDFGEMLKFLELCKSKKEHDGFIGVHLEGPFLSQKMCGAQNLSSLRNPSDADIEKLEEYTDVISRITIAPELSGTSKLTKRMLDRGIVMSAGHTDINAEEFYSARGIGINSVTHLYSSMKGRHKDGSYVKGGLIEAALADDECYVELIGDGHHVSRENLILTLKCKGADRVVLVSDAMRAAGLYSPFDNEFGESYLGQILPENRVIIENGVAKLPDRSSFAGSIAIGDTMVKVLVENYKIPLKTVSEIMSKTPADMLGLCDRGRFEVGYRADITILDLAFKTIAVLRNGSIAYNTGDNHA